MKKTLVTMLLVIGLMVGSAQAFESNLNVISPEQYQSAYVDATWNYLNYISPEQYQSAYVDATWDYLNYVSPEQYQSAYVLLGK